MKNLSVNISYFHQFSPIFWIFWHLLVSKKLMTSAYNRWCSHFFHFYRFFNNCIKLCWYYISSSWNMKEGGGKIEIDLPAEKTTLKKPSLIRVNVIKDWTIAREKTMLISEKIFKFSLLLSFYFFFFFLRKYYQWNIDHWIFGFSHFFLIFIKRFYQEHKKCLAIPFLDKTLMILHSQCKTVQNGSKYKTVFLKDNIPREK